MAESSEKIPPSKRRLPFLFRCFRSSPKLQTQKAPASHRRNRWTPSLFFRSKKLSATVPIDAASFSPDFKKPTPLPPPIKSGAPAVRAEIVEWTKPSRKKTESTQSNFAVEIFPPAKRTAALLHQDYFPSRRLNRQNDLKNPVSRLAATAPASSDRTKLPTKYPAKKFDPVILIVAVAIMVLWGRLCAILCTAAMFYFCRCQRSQVKLDGGGGCRIGGVS